MKKVLVSIPVYNEEKTLGSIIEKIRAMKFQDVEFSILVVDDGSKDRSASIAEEHGVFLIRNITNSGLGFSFRAGVKFAGENNFDIMVTIDGDGQFDPADIVKLIGPILKNEADFVTASRFSNKDFFPKMPALKRWGNFRVAKLVNRITKLNLHDVSCGFRAYSHVALISLDLIGDYTYTHETILVLAFRGFRIQEVDVLVRGEREFGKSKVARNVFKYAFNALLIIIRCLRDYKPFKFFGAASFTFLILGLLCLTTFVIFSIFKNEFYFKSLAFIGAFFIIWSGLLFIVALIADMFTRIRNQLDEIRKQISHN